MIDIEAALLAEVKRIEQEGSEPRRPLIMSLGLYRKVEQGLADGEEWARIFIEECGVRTS